MSPSVLMKSRTSAPTSPVRVLLIEDDPVVAANLAHPLDSAQYDLEHVTCIADGQRALASRQFDALIIDVELPNGNGLREVAPSNNARTKIPIVVLTAMDAATDRLEGFRGGMTGEGGKPFAMGELLAQLQDVLQRRSGEGRPQLNYRDLDLDLINRVVRRQGFESTLSTRETELMAFFLRNPERALSRDCIVEGVWGDDAEADGNVVAVYVNYLRNKTEAGGHARVIHTVRGVGYMLLDREPDEFFAV